MAATANIARREALRAAPLDSVGGPWKWMLRSPGKSEFERRGEIRLSRSWFQVSHRGTSIPKPIGDES